MVQNPTHAVVFWHPFNDAGGYGYLPLDKIKANNKPIVESLVCEGISKTKKEGPQLYPCTIIKLYKSKSIRIFVDNMLATN